MRRHSIVPCLALFAAAAAVVLAPSREARADVDFGVDFNFHSLLDGQRPAFGWGIDGRLGWRVPVASYIWITPELQGGYVDLNNGSGAPRILFGGRFTFGRDVQPTGFFHLGFAHLPGYDTAAPAFIGDPRPGAGNVLALDAGGALDFRLARRVFLGGQVAYNKMGTIDFVSFGPHLQMYF